MISYSQGGRASFCPGSDSKRKHFCRPLKNPLPYCVSIINIQGECILPKIEWVMPFIQFIKFILSSLSSLCRTHRVPTLLWFSPFSPPSSSSPHTKRIINKESHFGYLSTATHISYIVGTRRAPGFIGRWPRWWQRHTEWQIQRQRRGQIFQ